MLISIAKDKHKIVSGQKTSLIALGKKPPKIGDRLEFWENPRKADRLLLGVSLCESVQRITINPTLNTIYLDGSLLSQGKLKSFAILDGYKTLDDFWASFKALTPISGFVISWAIEYITKAKLLPQAKKQGDFLTSCIDKTQDSPILATDKQRLEFAYAWCQFCKMAGKCPIQKSDDQKAAHLVICDGSIACTAFTPARAQKWELEHRGFLELEKRGQMNILGGTSLA